MEGEVFAKLTDMVEMDPRQPESKDVACPVHFQPALLAAVENGQDLCLKCLKGRSYGSWRYQHFVAPAPQPEGFARLEPWLD